MRILVVGGSGYCSGHLVDRLLEEGHEVTVYDNLLYESRYLKKVDFVFGDCRDTHHVISIAKNFQVTIWTAALVGDPCCANNPALAYDVNYLSLKNFVDVYEGKICFLSTCSVYGKSDDILDEDSEVNPLSVYASTKFLAEQYLLKNCPNSLIFRLGTLFGIGDTYSRPRLDLVVNIFTLKACSGQKIIVNGATQWRPLLSVKDVGEALIRGIHLDKSGLYCLAWANYTIKEIAEMVLFATGSDSQIEYADIPNADARNYRVSTVKAEGWFTPKNNLAEGIKDLEKVFKEKRIKNPEDAIYNNGRWLK